MVIKKLVLLPIAFILGGCAQSTNVEYEKISIPNVNQEATATLGERLFVEGLGYFAETIYVPSFESMTTAIKGGTFYRVHGTNKFESNIKDAVREKGGSSRNYITYYESSDKICGVGQIFHCFDKSDVKFKFNSEKVPRFEPFSFQQSIEYNGKNGDVIKFTYREFNGDLNRPAFTTDFFMDLNEGNTIGYKGAVLEVAEATNSRIKYKVIKSFR